MTDGLFSGSAPIRRPPGAPADPEPSETLGVFGLSVRTIERDLHDEFSRHGQVESVTIVYDQRVSLITLLCVNPSDVTVRSLAWFRFHQNG
jgi:hypothetical protein